MSKSSPQIVQSNLPGAAAGPGSEDAPLSPAVCGSPPQSRPLIASNQIILCGRRFEVGARVISWADNPQISAYHPCCYSGADQKPRSDPFPFRPAQGLGARATRYRPRRELVGRRHDLELLKHVVRQVVIHHDGAESSLDCFHILHDERGLSAHFLVDNDGTLYQTMDVVDAAFHAQEVNGVSIGIEVCNRGLVERAAPATSTRGRCEQPALIHGVSYRMWSFTDEQYRTLAQLAALLVRLFPRLPAESPRSALGPLYTTLPESLRYSGFLGHYHVSPRKWDPGCFDFERILRPGGARTKAAGPPAPPRPARLLDEQVLAALTTAAERPVVGGYPMGPCGDDVVFHGGVHLALPAGAAWNSPLAGEVVAARLHRPDTAVGSPNFVLTRHSVELGGRALTFFLLAAHVQAARPGAPGAPPWLERSAAWGTAARPCAEVEVVFPGAPVAAGELLARVGVAGPPGRRQAQLHLEALAATEQTAALWPERFQLRDYGAQGPLYPAGEHQALLGGQPLRAVLVGRDPASIAARRALRRLAVRYRSEWAVTTRSRFEQSLQASPAFRRLPAAEREGLFCSQVAPMAWLNAEVARRTGLPADGAFWHYHPVELLAALAEGLRAAPGSDRPAAPAPPTGGPRISDGVQDDDEGYTSEEDQLDWQLDSQLLEFGDVSLGYPAHWLSR